MSLAARLLSSLLLLQNPLPQVPTGVKITLAPVGITNPIIYWDDASWIRGTTYTMKFYSSDGTLVYTSDPIDYSLLKVPTYQWWSANLGTKLPTGNYVVSVCRNGTNCSDTSILFHYDFSLCCL